MNVNVNVHSRSFSAVADPRFDLLNDVRAWNPVGVGVRNGAQRISLGNPSVG